MGSDRPPRLGTHGWRLDPFAAAGLPAAAVLLVMMMAALTGAATLHAPAHLLRRFEFSSQHMGTTFRVVLYAPDDDTATRGRDAAFAKVADLDQRLTDYRDDSELMRACAEAWRRPVALSPDVFDVLARGQAFAERSNGAFDMTVGALSKLWRHARRQGERPEAKELADARAVVGFRLMTLDASAHTLTLAREGVRLDLGGIAKGYAADRALQALRDAGLRSAIVVAGGDIALGEPPPTAGAGGSTSSRSMASLRRSER